MRGCFRAVLIAAILSAMPAIAAAQARGGGAVVSSAPASGGGRPSGPGRSTIAPAATRPVPPSQVVAWRPAPQRWPVGGVRNPSFVVWYGYLSFYTEWVDEVADSAGASLPPSPDGLPRGGLQLDVEPRRSQVYVDGVYAGPVDDFRGYYHHLDLPAGTHRVDLLLTGYPLQTIDVVVSPGRTTTYRGTLGSVMRVD